MRPVERVGGRCWEFEHGGVSYRLVNENGSDKVELYFRDGDGWVFRFSRFTRGRGAKPVAEEIYRHVTGS